MKKIKELLQKGTIHLMPALMLSQFTVEDQFGEKVAWEKFSSVPQVFVMGGKSAAESAKEWGVFLQKQFNGGFDPGADHLQVLTPNEKIKVLAVITLPDVPGIFKGLFRSGFRRESKTFGLLLDFDSVLSESFGYNDDFKKPGIVVVKSTEEGIYPEKPKLFVGDLKNEELKKELLASINKLLE